MQDFENQDQEKKEQWFEPINREQQRKNKVKIKFETRKGVVFAAAMYLLFVGVFGFLNVTLQFSFMSSLLTVILGVLVLIYGFEIKSK